MKADERGICHIGEFVKFASVMRKFVYLFLLIALAACVGGRKDPVELEEELLQEAARDVEAQRYEAAMEKGLMALEAARLSGDAREEVKALKTIIGIDIMTSRDADAWDKALEAESIARSKGFEEELPGILISKAKLCSYAEISPETGRNDEGLDYAQEALKIAKTPEDEAEACYVIASLYINKNRWSHPIDPEIYNNAGKYLDKGQAIAETHDIRRLRRNGIIFRSRWFQQGGRNEEAIRYFEQVYGSLEETDYVTAAALDDRLVRLYTRTGDAEKALETHDNYVFHIQKYLQQKQDETLQEMETRFEVENKEREIERRGYRISILIVLVLLALAVIALITGYLQRIRRRNAELQKINNTKEQLIAFLSQDLKNPANEYTSALEKLSQEATGLSGDEIREKCQEIARSAQSINQEVAEYVGDVLIQRSRRIADIGLSQREIQIIRLSAEGLTAAQIAEKLYLSVHTVNTHRQRIYSKMEVKNVSEMLRTGKELGII